MNNSMIKTSKEILNEVDVLLKKSGMSPEKFLSYIANSYNIKSNFEKDIIDYSSYYDSFIG